MKRSLLASVSVLVLSSATHAADWIPTKAPTIVAPSWAGFYLGIDGGVTSHDGYFNDLNGYLFNTATHSTSAIGGMAGGYAGYNWQDRSFVYGVEADINWVGANATEPWSLGTSYQAQQSQDISWLATFRGRAGIDVDSTLFYLTGGLALAQVKDSFNCSAGPSGFGCGNPVGTPLPPGTLIGGFSENTVRVGWTAGLGFEHMFDGHWTVRGELRYVDLGRTSVPCVPNLAGGCTGPGGTSYRGEFSNTLITGLVGVGYKF